MRARAARARESAARVRGGESEGEGGQRRGGRAREGMWRCMTRQVSVSTPNGTSSDNVRRPKTYGCFCPVVCFPLKGDAWGVPILITSCSRSHDCCVSRGNEGDKW